MSAEVLHAVQKLVRVIRQNMNVPGEPHAEEWRSRSRWKVVTFGRLLDDLPAMEAPDQVLVEQHGLIVPVASQLRVVRQLLSKCNDSKAEHVQRLFQELLDATVYLWARMAPDGSIWPAFYPVDPTLLSDLRTAAANLATVLTGDGQMIGQRTTAATQSDRDNPTDRAILKLVKRKALKGELIATKIGRSYDYVRSRLAGLVKRGKLHNTENGYLSNV